MENEDDITLEIKQQKMLELLKQNEELLKENSLLNLKMGTIKNIFELIKIKGEVEGDPLPSELDELIKGFLELTTVKNIGEVKSV